MKNPGLFRSRTSFFRFDCFLFCNYENGMVSRLRFSKPFLLFGSKYLFWILELTRRRNYMISGDSDTDLVVSKRQGELAPAKELLVLPTFHFVIYRHPREKLSDSI